jgi:hypothetical protein
MTDRNHERRLRVAVALSEATIDDLVDALRRRGLAVAYLEAE